jgi:hypothetical protein
LFFSFYVHEGLYRQRGLKCGKSTEEGWGGHEEGGKVYRFRGQASVRRREIVLCV